jgi:hypothetical protein
MPAITPNNATTLSEIASARATVLVLGAAGRIGSDGARERLQAAIARSSEGVSDLSVARTQLRQEARAVRMPKREDAAKIVLGAAFSNDTELVELMAKRLLSAENRVRQEIIMVMKELELAAIEDECDAYELFERVSNALPKAVAERLMAGA